MRPWSPADATRLVLSLSPNEVAEGRAVARRLKAVTEFSSLDIVEIGFIEDVEWRAHWDAMSRAQRRTETRAVRSQFIRLPPLAPEVTGHMTDQSFDGTSRFILGIDLDRREVHVLELLFTHPRFRIRDLARGEVLVTTRTEDGAWGIHVFQHGLRCAETQGAD